tara:strand:- start:453 stop:602 length:150 start_codon:yes stop_codon:yes gene_type:complete
MLTSPVTSPSRSRWNSFPNTVLFNGGAYRFFDGHSLLIIEEKVEQQWGD